MHGNKKNKRSNGRSIDGIIGNGGRLGPSTARLGAPSAEPFHPNRNQPVGSLGSGLRRAEGFHPMRAGSGDLGLPHSRQYEATEAEISALDEPIILDDITPRSNSKKPHGRIRLRRYFKRTTLFLLALILVGGIYLGFKTYKTQRHVLAGGGQAPAVCDGNVPLNQLKTEGDGRVNVLLLGLGGEEHTDGPYATDTIIIASIDPVNDKMDLLSIPRDLYVKIGGGGQGSDKINAAYLYGLESSKSKNVSDQQKSGINLIDQTLKPIIGVPIHYHAVVDFEAFRQSVNAIGGVDINVPKALAVKEILWDEGTRKNYQLNVPAGQQHFDGTRALFFARSRVTSPGGDFDRSERQRLTLVAIKDKALSAGTLTNPIKISGLLDSLGNNVYTDFDSGSIKCIAKQISEIPSSNIKSLDLVTPPNDFLYSSGLKGSTQSPKAGTYNFSEIQKFIRTSFRDGFLARENSSVAIYNATSIAGLATKEGDLLKPYGYNVTTVDSLPKATDPPKTTLIDLSGGADKYTRHYLEQRLGVTAGNSLPAGTDITPPTGTKFVIIVGKDANSVSQ